MFNISKRKQFNTVGELKELLADIPDNAKVNITGDDYCWFHIEEDQSNVNLDVEDLEECYE